MAFQAQLLPIAALSTPLELVVAVLFSRRQTQPFYYVVSAKPAALPKGRIAASEAYPWASVNFELEWQDSLPMIESAYHIAENANTVYTHFELNCGHHLCVSELKMLSPPPYLRKDLPRSTVDTASLMARQIDKANLSQFRMLQNESVAVPIKDASSIFTLLAYLLFDVGKSSVPLRIALTSTTYNGALPLHIALIALIPSMTSDGALLHALLSLCSHLLHNVGWSSCPSRIARIFSTIWDGAFGLYALLSSPRIARIQ